MWQEQDTSPEAVAAALRELLKERHADSEAFVPARVLNLVVIVDRDWRGEIQNRLDKVGSYHASRTILVSVEPGRTTIDASASMTAEEDVERGELAVAHEHVVLDIGEKHLKALDTIVDPLVVSDLATLLWSPHGHHEGVDAMAKLAQIILIDSVDTEGPEYAVRRSSELAERHYVVDLAWLRSTPWRERVASTFDPGQWRHDLASIDSVTVRHKPDSAMAGLLLLGWLSSRLGWEPGPMTEHEGGAQGKAKARKHEIKLALEPDDTMTAPGLAGITREVGHRHEHLAGPRSRRADGATARPPTARSAAGRSPGPRGASRASSARASARRCCATTPTRRRWPRRERMVV